MFSISVCTSFLCRFGGDNEQSIPYSGEEEKVRSTSTNHASPLARVLGTFSHTTYLPISCARWACFLDRSVAVNVSRSSAPFGLDLRDVFAYDLLPVQLHPFGVRFMDKSVAVNVSQSRFAVGSRSWDVFAYDLLPVQLHPFGVRFTDKSVKRAEAIGFSPEISW